MPETPVLDRDLQSLGRRIKERRPELHLSLRDVAAATDLSATFLSSLERGLANPTLESLRKVANALNTPILRMADSGMGASPVVKYNARRHISLPPRHVRLEILTPTLTRKMVLFQVRATKDDGNLVVQPLAEPTEECITVLAGHLSACVSGQTYELEAGDSIYFEGRDLESIYVLGDEETSYISAMTPPIF